MPSDIVRFSSHNHLRHRVVLAVLSGRSIRIDGIRTDDVQVGLRDYEISFLRLVEKITNGTTIEISVTGGCRRTKQLNDAHNRNIFPITSGSATRWELPTHMPSRQTDRLLPRGVDTSGAILQEAVRYDALRYYRTGGKGYDGECLAFLHGSRSCSSGHAAQEAGRRASLCSEIPLPGFFGLTAACALKIGLFHTPCLLSSPWRDPELI